MQLSAFAETVQAGIEHLFACPGKCFFMQAKIICEQIIQRFLARKIGRIFKKFGAELLRESDNFEQVAVAIAGKR